MSASDAYENKHLDAMLGAGYATTIFPGTIYVALFTAAPTDAGGGTEVAGGGYARVAVVNDGTNWPAAAGGQKKNGTVITFPTATASWGNLTHWGFYDALTAGVLGHYNALTGAPIAINSGMTPSFAVGALVLTAD